MRRRNLTLDESGGKAGDRHSGGPSCAFLNQSSILGCAPGEQGRHESHCRVDPALTKALQTATLHHLWTLLPLSTQDARPQVTPLTTDWVQRLPLLFNSYRHLGHHPPGMVPLHPGPRHSKGLFSYPFSEGLANHRLSAGCAVPSTQETQKFLQAFLS